jgi:hypothetical protein
MNTCRQIEPLLYLYREGERTEEESRMVDAHLNGCAACRGILEELRSHDGALDSVRRAEVEWNVSLVHEMMDRLAQRRSPRAAGSLFDLLRLVRPAFSAVVAVAVTILLVQVVQDGLQVATLERRLQSTGEAVRATTGIDELQPWRDMKPGSLDASAGISRAAINPLELLGPGIAKLFHQNSRLFESFSRKYPGLSTITTEDGLDDRERAILATEGKAFLSEIQQLLREGELQQ